MPLVLIDVIRGRNEDETRRLMDTVHDAMVEAFSVPDSDRYQILSQHEPHEMVALDTGLGLQRSGALTMIRLVSRERTDQSKQTLYRLLAERLQRECGVTPVDLVVTITENGPADWSFGGGVAQFLTGDL